MSVLHRQDECCRCSQKDKPVARRLFGFARSAPAKNESNHHKLSLSPVKYGSINVLTTFSCAISDPRCTTVLPGGPCNAPCRRAHPACAKRCSVMCARTRSREDQPESTEDGALWILSICAPRSHLGRPDAEAICRKDESGSEDRATARQ